jgi:hypothetical protein
MNTHVKNSHSGSSRSNSHGDIAGPRSLDALSARHLHPTQISREIRDQEAEIESMFRHLIRDSYDWREQSTGTRRQEIGAWISIVLLGLLSVLAVCLLYWKTT